MADTNFDPIAVAIYGALLVACGFGYGVLSGIIADLPSMAPELSRVLHQSQRKKMISYVLYLSSIPLAFVDPLISCIIFAIVGLMWIIPNKDVERALGEG